jgi:hypothetical protein
MDRVDLQLMRLGNFFMVDFENCPIMRVESGTSDLSVVARTDECNPIALVDFGKGEQKPHGWDNACHQQLSVINKD